MFADEVSVSAPTFVPNSCAVLGRGTQAGAQLRLNGPGEVRNEKVLGVRVSIFQGAEIVLVEQWAETPLQPGYTRLCRGRIGPPPGMSYCVNLCAHVITQIAAGYLACLSVSPQAARSIRQSPPDGETCPPLQAATGTQVFQLYVCTEDPNRFKRKNVGLQRPARISQIRFPRFGDPQPETGSHPVAAS